MATFTYDYEVTTSIPPARLFKSFILDDNFIPKVMPLAIKNVQILEGDGGVGTLKLVTFGEGSQIQSVKHRVDGLDEENFILKFTATGTEGGAVTGAVESVSYVVKMEATADGGSIVKTTSTYNTKGDSSNITEEEIKGGKERAVLMFKAAEAYLLANPDAYN